MRWTLENLKVLFIGVSIQRSFWQSCPKFCVLKHDVEPDPNRFWNTSPQSFRLWQKPLNLNSLNMNSCGGVHIWHVSTLNMLEMLRDAWGITILKLYQVTLKGISMANCLWKLQLSCPTAYGLQETTSFFRHSVPMWKAPGSSSRMNLLYSLIEQMPL